MLSTDWREKVPDEQAWCAICGEQADPQDFNTSDQERQIRDQGIAHLTGQLDDAFKRAPKPTTRCRGPEAAWALWLVLAGPLLDREGNVSRS